MASTPAAAPAPAPVNGLNILDQFMDMFVKFMDALHKTFPNCQKTAEYYNDVLTIVVPNKRVQKMVIEKWHSTLEPYYEACQKKDETVFLDTNTKIEILDNVNFRKKWLGLRKSPVSVERMWQFVQELNRFAAIYMTVPTAILQNMESVSGGIFQDVLSGRVDVSQLDVTAIGTQVLNGTSDMDAMELVKGMGKLFETIGNTSDMQAQMGPNGPKIPDIRVPDIQKIVKGFSAMGDMRGNAGSTQTVEDVFKEGWKPPS